MVILRYILFSRRYIYSSVARFSGVWLLLLWLMSANFNWLTDSAAPKTVRFWNKVI